MKKSAKIFIKIITALLAFIIVICATLGIYYAASKDCTLTVSVNTEKELQEISGWGTSDCWWADNIDDEQTRNEIANLLFSEDGLTADMTRRITLLTASGVLAKAFMFTILKRANMSMTGHEMQIPRLCFRRRLTEV